MVTDITEMAKSLKAAAEKAGADYWQAKKISGDFYVIRKGSYKRECGYTIYQPIAEIDHKPTRDYVAMANPVNILALVEALEKAQQRITQMESRTVTDWIEHDGKWRPESLGLDELVYLKTRKQELKIPYPAGKVKGWMNTGGDMDVMAYKLASPQASAVTVKLPESFKLAKSSSGLRYYYADEVDAALTAAGIKVEAE